MSRSADLAAVRRARCISAREGSVTRSGGRKSSCCSWWIRKVRCVVSADWATARNSATSTSAIGLSVCGFLRPGWSEEPAPGPPRLRKRGRVSGNRAGAVDEAVMGSPHRVWDAATWVASVGLRSPLCPRRRGPTRQTVGHIPRRNLPMASREWPIRPLGSAGDSDAHRRAPKTEGGGFSELWGQGPWCHPDRPLQERHVAAGVRVPRRGQPVATPAIDLSPRGRHARRTDRAD